MEAKCTKCDWHGPWTATNGRGQCPRCGEQCRSQVPSGWIRNLMRHTRKFIPLLLALTLSLSFAHSKPATDTTVRDTFTGSDGTALEGHQLDTGQTWQHAPYAASGVISIADNWAHHGSVAFRSIYLANAQLNADCFATMKIKFRDTTKPYLLLRAKSPTETYLAVYYDYQSQAWVMIATVDYVGPQSVYQLGSWAETITAGDSRDVRFEAVGDDLRLFINGVARISAESYYVMEGGMSGIGLYGSSGPAGTYLDNFEAGSITSGPGPSPSPTATPSPYPSPSPSPLPSPSPAATPVYEWRTFDISDDVDGQLRLLGLQGFNNCTEVRFKLRCSRRGP